MKFLLHWVVPFLAVLAAFWVREGLQYAVHGELPTFIIFYPVLMLVALLVGPAPGLLTAVMMVGVAGFKYYHILRGPHSTLPVEILSLVIFTGMAFGICALARVFRANRAKVIAFERDRALASSNEAKQAYDKLRIAKEDWERTFNAVPDLIAILDHKHRIVRANKAMADRLGVTCGQESGLHCYNVVHGTDAPPATCPHALTCKDGCEHAAEIHEPRLGGDFLVTTTPIKDVSGKFVGSVHVARDITSLKKTEQTLKESEGKYRRLFENLQEGFYTASVMYDRGEAIDFVYLDVNPAFERLMGLTRDKLIGQRATHVVNGFNTRWVQFLGRVAETGEPIKYDKYSEAFGRHYEIFAYRPDAGKVAVLVADITERKSAEKVMNDLNAILEKRVVEQTKALVEAHKNMERTKRLSDIGSLASTVAHELRNPLAAIKMASYNIKRKCTDPRLDGHLTNINIKVDESERIISNLLFYSRLKTPHVETVRIVDTLNACLEEARERYADKSVELTFDLGPIKDVCLEVDPFQIKEVFINILNNAFDALPEMTGVIHTASSISEGELVISFKDNGEGIAEADLTRVFEPFFSTKAKGTGLGLAVCQEMMHLHKGSISIESARGSGTCVMLSFPLKKG